MQTCVYFKKENEPQKLILYIDSLVSTDSCIYTLASAYLDEFSGRFYFDGRNGYFLGAEQSSYQLMFSIVGKEGSKNKISIRHRDWLESSSSSETQDYVVSLDRIFKEDSSTLTVLRINGLITAFREVGMLDAVVFFSSDKGFIGSYYSDPQYPDLVIERKGDILEDFIDYENYKFRVIL